jgi:hypothetical protein
MKSEAFITERLTVVNGHNPSVFIKTFIDYMPQRLDEVIELGLSERKQKIANNLDYFDFHYRKYVSGQHKTLTRVFFELRRSLDHGVNEDQITSIIDGLIKIIIEGEFYELLARVKSSRVKILKEIKKHNPLVPF